MTVQILRFKDGSDIICNTEKNNNMVELKLPMLFSMVNQNLILQHWLPLGAMKGNSVKVSCDDILCYMDPNDEFQEYYNTAVKKITSALENNKEDMEQMVEAIEELENSRNISIH